MAFKIETMNLSGIIAISGRPGLYKVITQGKNNVIVESLIDKKRFPAYASDRISALEDISIYTYEEDASLKDILIAIFKKEEGKECPSHKEDISILQNYILEILPNYDQERVYPSDLKKLFQWYNLLLSSGNLTPAEEDNKEEKNEDSNKSKKEAGNKDEKVASTKKIVAKSKTTSSEKSKPVKAAASAKKVSAVKTGSSRGK